MTKPPIITLITDFGLHDEYVGTMKGVILSYQPDARIIDISHAVAAQDILSGSFILARAYKFFPQLSVHLVVVDPGVGSERAILAVQADNHLFIGPDNGVLSPLLQKSAHILGIHRIEIPSLCLDTLGSTFHGRDIMAPVAARLASGMKLNQVGPAVSTEECCILQLPRVVHGLDMLIGEVLHIDHFGNLCSNITQEDINTFSPSRQISIQIRTTVINGLSTFYAQQPRATPLALFDSHNHLEIAISGGSAKSTLNASRGDKVIVTRRPA